MCSQTWYKYFICWLLALWLWIPREEAFWLIFSFLANGINNCLLKWKGKGTKHYSLIKNKSTTFIWLTSPFIRITTCGEAQSTYFYMTTKLSQIPNFLATDISLTLFKKKAFKTSELAWYTETLNYIFLNACTSCSNNVFILTYMKFTDYIWFKMLSYLKVLDIQVSPTFWKFTLCHLTFKKHLLYYLYLLIKRNPKRIFAFIGRKA